MRSKPVRDAGIIYLDHQATEVVTSRGVKWRVYGSPVSAPIFLYHLWSDFLQAAPLYAEGAFQYIQGREGQGSLCVSSQCETCSLGI